jgi:hypothetical protein
MLTTQIYLLHLYMTSLQPRTYKILLQNQLPTNLSILLSDQLYQHGLTVNIYNLSENGFPVPLAMSQT